MLLRDLMLALARRTVHYGNMLGFGPGMETTTEAPGHPHQVVVVQILIKHAITRIVNGLKE